MTHLLDLLLGFPPWLVLLAAFLLPAAEASMFVGLFFPGELAIILGGVLANQHKLSLWMVVLVGSAGAIAGDSIGYEVGRRFGDRIAAKLPPRLVRPSHIERGKELLRMKGGRAIFIGRFTAALRALLPGLAGTSRVPYRVFAFYNVLGGVSWVTVTALTGYVVGSSYHTASGRLSLISYGILGAVLLTLTYSAVRRSRRAQEWKRRHLGRLRPSQRRLLVAAVALVAAGWWFIGVTQDVLERDGLALADVRLQTDVFRLRDGGLTVAAKIATLLGTSLGYAFIVAAGVLVWRRRGRWQPLVAACAWLALGQAVRLLISRAIARPRPPTAVHLVHASGYAFPSGHTATATMSYALLATLLALAFPRIRRWILVSAAAVIALAVGLSRVYLGVHWPSDVIGGWAFGLAWLTAGWVIALWLAGRFPNNNVVREAGTVADAQDSLSRLSRDAESVAAIAYHRRRHGKPARSNSC